MWKAHRTIFLPFILREAPFLEALVRFELFAMQIPRCYHTPARSFPIEDSRQHSLPASSHKFVRLFHWLLQLNRRLRAAGAPPLAIGDKCGAVTFLLRDKQAYTSNHSQDNCRMFGIVPKVLSRPQGIERRYEEGRQDESDSARKLAADRTIATYRKPINVSGHSGKIGHGSCLYTLSSHI